MWTRRLKGCGTDTVSVAYRDLLLNKHMSVVMTTVLFYLLPVNIEELLYHNEAQSIVLFTLYFSSTHDFILK